MDKNIKTVIYNCVKKPIEVIIEDVRDIKLLTFRVISGDEQLVVRYNNGKVIVLDSDGGDRFSDFFDGEYDISFDELSEIADMPDSFDALTYFYNKRKQ